MICSKKKNKAVLYRRLKGMTQQNVADILRTGKSNIANMESEKFNLSETYKKLLEITPREARQLLFSMEKALNIQNISRIRDNLTNCKGNIFIPVRTKVFDSLESPSSEKSISSNPVFAGEFNGTDIFAWKSEFELPELNIKKGKIFPIVPKFFYDDGSIVLYRETRRKFKVAKVLENGTILLSLTDENSYLHILEIEIIGEIITK